MLRRTALLGLAAVLACGDKALTPAPPSDRFYFPTGLAVRHVPAGCVAGTAGCQSQLLVVSSNFDLLYDPGLGGTLISVDVGQALAAAAAGAPSPVVLPPLGSVRIGSFGGELALVDAETCPGWTGGTQALVASRSLKTLYRVDVDAQGGLSCAAACPVPLASDLADPYGVSVACGSWPSAVGAPPTPQQLAFVTYLRAPDLHGWLSQLDLSAVDASGQPTSPLTRVDLQVAPTHQSFFDPRTARLYVTGRFAGAGYDPLRFLELAAPGYPPRTINLEPLVRGAETRGLALSTDRTRAYVAIRIFDEDTSVSFNARPAGDLAGALVVLDLTERAAGGPALTPLRVVPLEKGPVEVRAVARPGQRDLVAVTSSDDSTVTLFDDELGVVAASYGVCGDQPGPGYPAAPAPCAPGQPAAGVQPFGLAVEPLASGQVRLYVGSFDRGFVNVIQLDPSHPDVAPTSWVRIGAERP